MRKLLINSKLLISILVIITVTILIVIGAIYFNQKDKSNLKKTTREEEKEQETKKEENYRFVINAYDSAETTTAYDIVIKEKEIKVQYKNTFAHPELADGPLPEENGEYIIKDEYFTEPLKKVFIIWKDSIEDEDYTYNDTMSLLLSSLEKSQIRTDDLCQVYGWYCDVYEDLMDYNEDGKITVEESFSYYINSIDASILTIDDNRDNTIGKDEEEWDAKGLVPELKSSTSAKNYKTNEKVNKIVLNGITYEIGVDTFKKLLDNGFIMRDGDNKTVNTIRKSSFGYFKDYPDAKIYYTIHSKDYMTETPIEDCIIGSIEVYFKTNTANLYYWKIKDFIVNENTTKTQINNYFDLAEGGGKTVYLYTDKYLVTIECGSIYETHEYSNIFKVEAQEYIENMQIPVWAK